MNKFVMLMCICVALSACTRAPHKAIFSDSATMESVLRSTNNTPLTYTKMPHSKAESRAHNSNHQPHKNVFRELENPTLVLYIEPHVTARDTYIPGFSVPFKLYQQVEFALPGEN